MRATPAILGAGLALVACACGVPEPRVVEVVVMPEEALIVGEGHGERFTAFASDAAGKPVAATVAWSVDRPRSSRDLRRGIRVRAARTASRR